MLYLYRNPVFWNHSKILISHPLHKKVFGYRIFTPLYNGLRTLAENVIVLLAKRRPIAYLPCCWICPYTAINIWVFPAGISRNTRILIAILVWGIRLDSSLREADVISVFFLLILQTYIRFLVCPHLQTYCVALYKDMHVFNAKFIWATGLYRTSIILVSRSTERALWKKLVIYF